MSRSFRYHVIPGLLLVIGLPGLAESMSGEAPDPSLTLTVWVLDYAGTAPDEMARAEQEATRILNHAGLGVAWVHCPVSPERIQHYPACQQLPGPIALVVQIRPRSMAVGAGRRSSVFGHSLFPEDGGFGTYAYVYSDGPGILARGQGMFRPVLLGHLIAHEVGHLLLGTVHDSATGIMSCPWRGDDLTRVAQGQMLFSRKQARRLQAKMRGRADAQLSSNRSAMAGAPRSETRAGKRTL